MIIFSDRKDIEPAQLVALYRQAPWATTRTQDDTCDMLAHTDVAITAWDGQTWPTLAVIPLGGSSPA